jgi:uncharacterized membrane protein
VNGTASAPGAGSRAAGLVLPYVLLLLTPPLAVFVAIPAYLIASRQMKSADAFSASHARFQARIFWIWLAGFVAAIAVGVLCFLFWYLSMLLFLLAAAFNDSGGPPPFGEPGPFRATPAVVLYGFATTWAVLTSTYGLVCLLYRLPIGRLKAA